MTKPTKRAKSKKVARDPETRRRALFVKEYLVDLVAKNAAVRAGYSETSARQIGHELLLVPEIQEKIKAGMEKRSSRVEITADKVLERWWAVATADANELSEMRRVCCRYCYGKNHEYQRTPREMQDAIAQFERDKLAQESKGLKYTAQFNAAGGVGFDPRKDPQPGCPECFGQGTELPFYKDTRDLSPAAKLLFAGVETTQHGLKIKTHSQSEAMVNVAKHIGMLTTNLRHSNDPNNPMPAGGVVIVPAKDPVDGPGA